MESSRTHRSTSRLRESLGLILLGCVLGWSHPAPGQVSVQVIDVRTAASNVVQLSVTLSNSASRSLNIMDSLNGRPAHYVQPDPKLHLDYRPEPAHVANSLKFNLASGATLDDTFQITNPPPRFRILFRVRDPAAEKTPYSGIKLNAVLSPVGEALEDLDVVKEPEPELGYRLAAKSDWVESKVAYVPAPRPSYTNWIGLTGRGVIGTPDNVPDFMFGGMINPSCRDPKERAGNWHVDDSAKKLSFNATSITVVQSGHLPGSAPGPVSRKPSLNFIDFSGDGTLRGYIANPTNFGTVFFTARAVVLGVDGKRADQFYLRVYNRTGQTLMLISSTPSTPEVISPVPARDSDFRIFNCDR